MADKYNSMKELLSLEPMKHYRLSSRRRKTSRVLVMSPHGGAIEYFTSEIADRVAGKEFKLYDFAGIMSEHNFANLHVTSSHYDCALAKGLNEDSDYTIAIHGCKGSNNERVTYLGGQDLEHAGFTVKEAPENLSGKGPDNVVNQNRRGMGIQLEISMAQRMALTYMPIISALLHKKYSKYFERYCDALRIALSEMSREPLTSPDHKTEESNIR